MAIPPTLASIETKVRRLTRSPSTAQLSQADLDDYINTFILYDFPEHLRLFDFRQTFTFVCNPYQDVYPLDISSFAGVTSNPLYNFQNIYISVHEPVYMAGYQGLYAQSRERFFGIYPKTNAIINTGKTGNGTLTSFTGTIPIGGFPPLNPNPVNQLTVLLKNEVLFSSVDINNNAADLVDVPILDAGTGNPTNFGQLVVPSSTAPTPLALAAPYQSAVGFPSTNFINYLTGAYTITFNVAPKAGQIINAQVVPVITALPQALLFFDNKFVLRPVPDQPYRIQLEVFKRPTALLNSGSIPQLEQWASYIAYGAARKVFQDRMDMDSVALLDPEYRKQELLVLRKTILENTNERTATIYTEQSGIGSGGNGWGWGGGAGTF
jgi:hypothetical protein